jgi:hypothetical protein
MATDSVEIFNSMYFWSQDNMPMSYGQLEERYKAQILYYLNSHRFTYFAMYIQCGLDTLLNLPFRSTFLIYEFILSEHKRCLVFVPPDFDLNIIFSNILSIF